MSDVATHHDADLPRRVLRTPEQGWIGGVCLGIAEHLGIPVLALRVVIVLLASWKLIGIPIYLLLWLLMPRTADHQEAPGLAMATREGMRTDVELAVIPLRRDLPAAMALGLLGLGALWLVQWQGWGLPWVWMTIALAYAGGLALVWWQADHASTSGISRSQGLWWWLVPLARQWTTVLALVLGVIAVAGAIVVGAALLPGVGNTARTFVAIMVSLFSLVALTAPWLLRVRRSLDLAREQQLVANARADMAAHLHDSVLQTLALIQRHAAEPSEVSRLARRQERELREWLYGTPTSTSTLRAALAEIVQDIEDDFPVAIESVVVGDVELDARTSEIVRAAGEALTNAAKHSGADRLDLYAEITDDAIEIFVRDRGPGFDLDDIPDDRHGIRRSIMERMTRHQGTARIRSDAERGTEVTLEMKR